MEVSPSLLPDLRPVRPALAVSGEQDFKRLSETRLPRSVTSDDNRQARARTESQGLLRPNPSKTLNGQGGNVCGGLVHCGRLGGSFCLGLGFKQEGLNRLLTVACGHDETAPVFL